jgi:hypothetical protein
VVRYYILIGQEDTLAIENGVLRNRQGVLLDPKQLEPGERDGGLLQDREFVNAVQERREPAISADAVLPALDALQQAQDQYDSWRPEGHVHPVGG